MYLYSGNSTYNSRNEWTMATWRGLNSVSLNEKVSHRIYIFIPFLESQKQQKPNNNCIGRCAKNKQKKLGEETQ